MECGGDNYNADICHLYSILKENQVTLFGNHPEYCQDTKCVKGILEAKRIKMQLINIEAESCGEMDFKSIITKMCGFKDIPAIFVGRRYLGGQKDL
jgi:glutaredoxin